MAGGESEQTDSARVHAIEASFQVQPRLYLLGSLERGVTVYNQQVRAHNLTWALWDQERRGTRRVGSIAVVGGGIAGLTAAACLLSLFEGKVSITLFERLWDLCPLQQGADARWLHPRIYDWPERGSRAPGASLPVLDWSEGRASDVARTILREFANYCDAFDPSGTSLSAYLGLRHFQIDPRRNEISWIGSKGVRNGPFFHAGDPEGQTSQFDTIILAAGFGLERRVLGYATESYWRNEQLSQPNLDGSQQRYLVSGYGDGALIDLCRLTVERFRQDTIVYELFRNVEKAEARLGQRLEAHGRNANMFELFKGMERGSVEDREILNEAKEEISRRIRKDTRVNLHINGSRNEVKTFQEIFGRNSSLLNRLMTFLLYRCGAFGLAFSDLAHAVEEQAAPAANVVCRHGADTSGHLKSLFVDHSILVGRFAEMAARQEQSPRLLWAPGVFRHHSQRRKAT